MDDLNTKTLDIIQNNKQYTMKLKVRSNDILGIRVSTGEGYDKKNYYGEFALEDLRQINQVFVLFKNIDQVQEELSDCVKRKDKCSISEKEDFCHILYFLELGTDASHLSIALPRNEEPRIIDLEKRHAIFKIEDASLAQRIQAVERDLDIIKRDQDQIMRDTQELNREADEILGKIPSYGVIPQKEKRPSILRSKRPTQTSYVPPQQPYIPPPSNDFPNGIKKDIIKDENEIAPVLDRCGCRNCKLLFKGKEHGDSAFEFHKRCDGKGSTLVLVETTEGKRFGGFTTQGWEGNNERKFDDRAFIFKIPAYGGYPEIYSVIPGKEAIACYPGCGPCFSGCQIRIFDRFFTDGGSTSHAGAVYETKTNNELNDGQKEFGVKDVEVYECN